MDSNLRERLILLRREHNDLLVANVVNQEAISALEAKIKHNQKSIHMLQGAIVELENILKKEGTDNGSNEPIKT
jgi:hypothetical protein